MNWRKFWRAGLVALAVFVGFILLLVAISIAPIDRHPDRNVLYEMMRARIDSLPIDRRQPTAFSVGYAKVDLTPTHHTATAGYGKRLGEPFTTVLDSIYVRTLVVDNGVNRVAIVSTDLLIIPPTVTTKLEEILPEIGFSLDNTYLTAVHSHNSIGNWGKGLMTILYGTYSDTVVQFIAGRIAQSVLEASKSTVPSSIVAGSIPLDGIVHNRLIHGGPVDSLLRVMVVEREDSTRLVMLSSTAHATCLSSRDLRLSADYPGKLVKKVEASGYNFAMFMAGAVGSHTGSAPEQGEYCTDWMANHMANVFLQARDELRPLADSSLFMTRVPLLLSPPQPKVFHDWRLRPWVFNLLFGDYPEYLTSLRIGDVIMLGTPCDFSGEFSPRLDSLADSLGKRTMVTSFNGGYIGYVTPDDYYDIDHYETQLMSWYGPGNGSYIATCLEQLLRASAAAPKQGAGGMH